MSHPWPLFDLRLRTPRLELRLPDDDDVLALCEVARAGIADEGRDVFLVPWHELPSPAFERNFLLHHWKSRGGWDPERWSIQFAVVADGSPVGVQEIGARDFATRRVVSSGSWMGAPFQGRGYGTEMRAAILYLAFEGLGADAAESGYIEGNSASARISEKLGYRPNGIETIAPRGTPILEHRVRVTRETWSADLVRVTIEGLEPCLALFGAAPLGPNDWPKL